MAKVKKVGTKPVWNEEIEGKLAARLLMRARDQRAFVVAFLKECDPITLAHFVAECDAPKPPAKRRRR